MITTDNSDERERMNKIVLNQVNISCSRGSWMYPQVFAMKLTTNFKFSDIGVIHNVQNSSDNSVSSVVITTKDGT